jgi:hypothetical protein
MRENVTCIGNSGARQVFARGSATKTKTLPPQNEPGLTIERVEKAQLSVEQH